MVAVLCHSTALCNGLEYMHRTYYFGETRKKFVTVVIKDFIAKGKVFKAKD